MTTEDINPANPLEDQGEQEQEVQEEVEENTDSEKELSEETQEEQPQEEPKEEEKGEEKEDEKPKEEEEKQEAPASLLSSLAKEYIPDGEFESDEQAQEAMKEYLGGLKETIGKHEKKDEKITEMITAHPDFADLIFLVGQGADPDEAWAVIKGESEVDLDDAKEGWKKAAADRDKSKKEHEKRLKQIRTNWDSTFKTLDDFAKDKNMDKEQTDGMLAKMDDLLQNVTMGKIPKEMMEVFYKGLSYDTQIKDAVEKAEVKGRNEAIKEVKTKKKTQTGDDLPHPESAATTPPETQEKNDAEARLVAGINAFADRKF